MRVEHSSSSSKDFKFSNNIVVPWIMLRAPLSMEKE